MTASEAGSNLRAASQRLEVRALNLALLMLLAWLALRIVAASMGISPEFDGAMNLLESRSIAEGHGPRAVYDSNDLFPPGVQTKEPYVLLGAMVFKLAGVGPFQIELPNLLFLLALCTVAVVVFRKMFGTTTALLACILLLAYPRLLQYGLRGYGEIPTLFFGLTSLALVAWPDGWPERIGRRCFWAGACAGLAVATKVVGIAQVAIVGVVLLCRLAGEPPRTRRDVLVALAAFGAGVGMPLAMVEAWRWFWLGGGGYRAWWLFQLGSIRAQSGAGAQPQRINLAVQVARRFLLLCGELQLRPVMMGLMLLAPVAAATASFLTFTRDQRYRCRWLLVGLLLLAAVYFVWWLAIVPEEKAWVRYIYIALIDVAFLAAIAAVAGARAIAVGRRGPVDWLAAGLSLLVLLTYSPLVARVIQQPLTFARNDETTNTIAAAALLSRLPTHDILLGYGWYGAPSIQIYLARPFMDLSDFAVGRLIGKTSYLVADRPTLVTGMLDRTLSRYPHRALRANNLFAQVYSIDFAHPLDPFIASDPQATKSDVTFSADNYAATEGMEPYDPIGGRFIESDSEILLRYDNQRSLRLVGYMDAANPSYYRWPPPMVGQVFIGDCPPLRFVFDSPGWRSFVLPLACRPPSGNVRVRIVLDNVLDLPLLKDRQKAMLLNSIGFVDTPPGQVAPTPG